MGFTRQEFETLARLIDSGKNTYADIHTAFPYWDDRDFYDLIGNPFNGPCPLALNPDTIMLFFEECPADYTHGYKFRGADAFRLSAKGSDILYQLRKERRQELLTVAAAISSIIAAICSLIGLLQG